MNRNAQPSYKKSFLLALGFHALVLMVIVFNHISREVRPAAQLVENKNKIISAQIITEIKLPKVPELKVSEVEKIEKIDKLEKPEKKFEKTVKIEKPEKPEKQLEKINQEKLAQLEQEKQEKIKLKKAKQEQEKQERLAKIEQIKKQEQEQREQAKQEAERLALLKSQQAQQAQDEHQQLLRIIDRYALLMRAKIHQNWRRPVGMDNLYKCKVAVKLRANGEVISARVIDSSGNIEFDRSAELAILKSSPLPMPPDEKMRTPFNQFTFTFEPETA